MIRFEAIFSRAKSFRDAGRLLDQYLAPMLRFAGTAVLPVEVSVAGVSGLAEGSLVQIQDGGRVRKASAEATRHATHVIVEVTGTGTAWVARVARVRMVFSEPPAGTREVFLGDFGGASLTKPTTGLLQSVGFVVSFDAAWKQHLVDVLLDSTGGIFLGS
jgi:hypothetical protein